MQNVIAVRTGVIDDLLLEWCKKEEIAQVGCMVCTLPGAYMEQTCTWPAY